MEEKRIRQSIKAYFWKILLNGFFALAFLSLGILFLVKSPAGQSKEAWAYASPFLALSLYNLAKVGWSFLKARTSEYVFTPNFIKSHYGILNKAVDTVDVTKVKDLSLRRSFWDRMLGISKLYIVSSDKTNPVTVAFGLSKTEGQEMFDFVNLQAVDTFIEARGRKASRRDSD